MFHLGRKYMTQVLCRCWKSCGRY